MKQARSIAVVVMLAVVAGPSSATGQAAPPINRDRAAVLATLDAYHAASARRDADALDRLYAPEYFHVNPDGSLLERAAVLAIYRAPATAPPAPTRRDEDRVSIDGNNARVTSRFIQEVSSDDHAIARQYRITWTLHRAGSKWQITFSQATLMPDRR